MSIAKIRTAITDMMKTVPNIGLVHDFERYSRNKKDFREFYLQDNQVLGWFIRRVSTRTRPYTAGAVEVTHEWQIRGYMSLEDDKQSEIVFDDLIEDLRSAFNTDPSIGGAVTTNIVNGEAGLQLTDSGPVMFAGILSHSCRLTFLTQHFESTETAESGEITDVYVGKSPETGLPHKPDYDHVQTGEPLE